MSVELGETERSPSTSPERLERLHLGRFRIRGFPKAEYIPSVVGIVTGIGGVIVQSPGLGVLGLVLFISGFAFDRYRNGPRK